MNIFRVLSGRRKWLLAVSITFSTIASAQLATYPEGVNAGMPHNDDYTVRVRVPGGRMERLVRI